MNILIPLITLSLMADYRKRMSTAGIKAYARTDILEYSSVDTLLGLDDEEKIIIHGQYLPGFLSFQRSIDRYLINRKYDKKYSAKEIRNLVINSFSLKSDVWCGRWN